MGPHTTSLDNERPLYLEAEDKQWQEHVSFGAVRPLSLEESKMVEDTVHPSRILRARYAYKGKNQFGSERHVSGCGPRRRQDYRPAQSH